jgi:hypothetical protein
MFRFFSAQSLMATAAAALVGGLATFMTQGAPSAFAQPGVSSAVQGAHAKADRLPRRVTGSACSTQSWPSFDQNCQFDLRRPADDVRTVRVVSLLRQSLPAAN